MCLVALYDAHLEVDGVSYDVDLCGVEAVEDVALVPVHVSDGILVAREAFLYEFLVIHVAFLHAEDIRELLGVIYRVAHPFDVADVVFLSLIDLYEDIDVLVVVGRDAVGYDACVAIAVFVVFLYEVLLVFLISFGSVFLRLEEGVELTRLVGLCQRALGEERTLDFLQRHLVVSDDGDLVDFHLLFLVDFDIENHHVLLRHIVALTYVYLCVVEAFVVKVFLCQHLGSRNHVRRDLRTLHEAEFLLHVLSF